MKLYLSIALSIRPFVSPSLCIFRLFRIPPSASSDEPCLGFKLKIAYPICRYRNAHRRRLD
jgi:hypothetical protein